MKQPVQTPDAAFIEKYIEFCQSPLHTNDDIRQGLDRLVKLPLVELLAFADESKIRSTLMIGLRPVIIMRPSTGRRHRVGSFIVYLTRYRDYPAWVAMFRLVNTDGMVMHEINGRCYHPHMRLKSDSEIGEVADLCISRGQSPILNCVRKGQLDRATALIINLLHSLGPHTAYCDISAWPIATDEGEDYGTT
jgi:hypothetical protein